MNRSRAATRLALAFGLAAAGGTAHAAVIYDSAPEFTNTEQNGVNIPLAGNSGPGRITSNVYGGMFYPPFVVQSSWAQLSGDPESITPIVSLNDVIGSSRADWTQVGNVTNDGTYYFGISFNNGGTTNYGWMQVTASGFGDYDSNQSFTVNSYAYDDTGASIEVGATTSAVPETSTSFGLLALGAGGLLTRRRLKRAAWAV